MQLGPQQFTLGPIISDQTNCPISAANLTALTGIIASAMYNMTIGSGNLPDVVGANTLTIIGSPGFRKAIGGRVGIDYSTPGTGHAANVNSPGLNSAIIACIATYPASSGTVSTIFGLSSSTTFPSFALYRNTATVFNNLLLRDTGAGTVLLDASPNNLIVPNIPYLYMAQLDKAANLGRLVVCSAHKVIVNVSASAAGFVTLTGGVAPLFGFGTFGTMDGGSGSNFGFYAQGVQCEGTTKLLDIAYRLGFGR